ncbi:MAG TPA: DUF4252 domain-containing protein [Pyrinomonadaceae bacterium]|jgi:Zn-dependent alcohol dehydrogenase
MKLILLKSKIACMAFLITLFLGITAQAQQDARLQLQSVERLEARASQVVDVNIDQRMLQLASKFLSGKNPNEQQIKELVAGLRGVYVKVYEFDKDGEFSMTDVETLRTQLRSPGWSRMVGVTSKRDQQVVEVYIMTTASEITGMAVIASEPKQLTIVNIVGPIDIDKLSRLGGNFGIPQIEFKRNDKDKE